MLITRNPPDLPRPAPAILTFRRPPDLGTTSPAVGSAASCTFSRDTAAVRRLFRTHLMNPDDSTNRTSSTAAVLPLIRADHTDAVVMAIAVTVRWKCTSGNGTLTRLQPAGTP